MILIGTKAQFIKTAPIMCELDSRSIPYRLVYTGQHSETFDLLEVAFGTRCPDDVLVADFEASTHASFLQWCWRYWIAIAQRMRVNAYRGVRIGLVHGDTASTLFGGLAVRMFGARVAHVEAGLRSPQLLNPFPEEIIRRLMSRLSVLHFVPDGRAETHLANSAGEIINTGGNTLRDALRMALSKIGQLPAVGGSGAFALISIHRSENLTRRADFDLLMEEVLRISQRMAVKFVLHPATREKIHATGWFSRLQSQHRLELLERMDYPDFVSLLVHSRMLLTDGGSNQEEAAMLGLPTLLLRRTTERSDGLGDNVSMSNLQRESIRRFVAEHETTLWPLRLVAGPSPSALVVDALEDALKARAAGEAA